MAMIEEALAARLAAHSGLAALVGARVYAVLLPQRPTYPAVTYYKFAAERETKWGSDTGIARASFQVTAWAPQYSDAKLVSAQMRAALQRFRGTVSGVEILDIFIEQERDLYDDEAQVHYVAMDFEVIHRE